MRRATAARLLILVLAGCAAGCGAPEDPAHLTFSGSAVGTEGAVIRSQLQRFAAAHPGTRVDVRVTPDAADARHQLYVQWLNGHATEPDVLQLDIIWTAEFAAAGWILPLDRFEPDTGDFFPGAVAANTWRRSLYALPWFVDVGLLYWRTDLLPEAPPSLAALATTARALVDAGQARLGLASQGARYEGLITVFVEHLAAFGGGILDDEGAVIVDAPEAVRALEFMRDNVRTGVTPAASLAWQEEHARLAFQNGQAAFMRNWPYAWALLQDPSSAVAGQFAVTTFPAAPAGRRSAALGGAQLAINARTASPELAWALIEFLTAPEQMLERARVAAQLPSRQSLYGLADLAEALPIPSDAVRAALDAAVARPVTPVYSELSEILQVRLHRALTGQQMPDAALRDAAREIRTLLARTGLAEDGA
jgi:multiple sugar transport system substrate-binding protein